MRKQKPFVPEPPTWLIVPLFGALALGYLVKGVEWFYGG